MLKKIVIVLLGLVLLLALSSVVLSVLYKKEIHAYIIKAANDKLNARFSFKDVSVGIIKSFPRLGVDIEDVQIIGKDHFEKDTLAILPKASIQVNITDYILHHKISIEKIKIESPKLYLKVLKTGEYNWDIVKTDSAAIKDTTQKPMQIALKKYIINNANIIYDDHLRGIYTSLEDVTHVGSGDFTKDVFSLDTKTNAQKLSFAYLGKSYLSEVTASLEAPIQMNFTKMEFAFKNNDIKLNQLPIHFDAWFAMPDSSIDMDVKFDAATSPLKDFLSLVPILYQNSFKELTASGKFALNGYLKGKMTDTHMPGFGMGLLIENGAFKYASIPAGIIDMNVNLKIDNSDGIIDHTVIDVKRLQLRLNQQSIAGTILVKTPQSNPYINAKASGALDLGALLKIIPQKNLQLTGKVNANFDINGYVNELKSGKGFAKGNFDITQLHYLNENLKKEISIPQANFTITPQKLFIKNCGVVFGKSDFTFNGSAENYLLYVLKNEAITGNVSMNSKQIDLNELMSLRNSKDTLSNTSFELPKNIQVTASAKIDHIKYKDFDISNASGGVAFADQKVNFNKLSFSLLEAQFNMNGSFSKQEKQDASLAMNFGVQNLDIHKAYQNFEMIQKYMPIAEAIQGTMNANLTFTSKLLNTLSPNLSTINSDGDLYLIDANLNGSNVLNKIAALTKWDLIKNIATKAAHLSFQVQNGRLITKPFDVITNATKLTISGSNGLDKSIDYTIAMDMPKQVVDLGGASELNKELVKINPNLSLDKIAKAIKLQILVSGNMQNPTVKLGLKGSGTTNGSTDATHGGQIKETVGAAVKQQVNTKLEQAQQQADAIIEEAKIAAEKMKQEAYDRADKMVADVQNPLAKMGIKIVADKLKKEADNKSNQIMEQAHLKAKDIIEKAKNQQ